MIRFTKGSLLATTMMASAAFAVPAYAQDAASNDSTNQEQAVQVADPAQRAAEQPSSDATDIVVTGSRIVRRDLESAAPVAVIQDEEFKLSGSVNVEQVTNTLPQVVPGASAFSNNPGGGVATLNLRGLGTTRTLLLVNGRRYMFFDASQVVDLNTIPSFLIDSVDVVTGGASAVYGSDALAGVVNFRLRNDLQGVEVGGQYSLTEEGDGQRFNTYVAIGSDLGDGRGHATVFGEYYKRDSILQGDRSFSSAVNLDDGAGGFIPGGSGTTPQGRFTSTYPTANCPTTNVFCSPGAFFTAPGVSRRRTGADLYNYGPANYLMVPQERYLIGGYADYDIGGGHTPYVETTFVNNRVANELAATPVTGTFQVRIASVAPFLSAADRAALTQLDGIVNAGNVVGDGIVPISVARRVTETGSRNTLDERNAFRFLTGIKGPVMGDFRYDLYYSYARTRNSNVQAGNISRSAFQRGLDGTDSPINIFGPDTLTSDMVDQISILAQNGESSVLQVLSGSVAGSVTNFGWGADDVGIAVGGEYRKMKAEFIPDTALSSGDVIGFNAGDPTAGQYNVKEVFGELRVPIAARRPGIYSLEVTGAARYSDYSLENVGGVSTYAAGATYAPIRDITFRAQYQHAVRAPNIGELFGGQSQGFPGATDPCSNLSSPATRTPALRALCIALGVPAGAVFGPIQANTQIQGTFGGNPDLQEETSDSFTAGIVLRPTFLPGFSMTVDYFNIKVEGAISTLGGGLANTLDLCFNQIQDINSEYCQVFVGTRNALGELDGVNPPSILNANTGLLKVEGVDLQADYSTRLPFGLLSPRDAKLNLSFLGTYTRKSDLTPVADLPDVVDKCAGKFGVLACGQPTPKYKWTSRASFIDGPLTTSLRWRHLSSVRDDDDGTDYTVERIKAYNLFDLSFAVDVTEKLSLSAGANNLFNKKPQGLGSNQEQANTYPSTYDVLGRDYFVSARIKL